MGIRWVGRRIHGSLRENERTDRGANVVCRQTEVGESYGDESYGRTPKLSKLRQAPATDESYGDESYGRTPKSSKLRQSPVTEIERPYAPTSNLDRHGNVLYMPKPGPSVTSRRSISDSGEEVLEEDVDEGEDDEDLRHAYTPSSRKRNTNPENSLRKHHIQSLKKKKGKANLRAEVSVIAGSDAEVPPKRRKTSGEGATRATAMQIDDPQVADTKLYADLIHHATEPEPPIFDRVDDIFGETEPGQEFHNDFP